MAHPWSTLSGTSTREGRYNLFLVFLLEFSILFVVRLRANECDQLGQFINEISILVERPLKRSPSLDDWTA